ncbi:MAG: NADH-quinone oxidoreductase subunit I [Rubrivivax sp.]|nr:NADH-quinone oxidoreductase subunit I [Rubrivivax sp.]
MNKPAPLPKITRPKPRKTYWNEPTLGWYEKAFIFEIVRGLMITGRVFFSNMAKWVTGRKGALTAYYPEEVRADYSPINRGRHVLTTRPNGEVQCVACNLCATVCPAYCIEIVAAPNAAEPAHPKSPLRFEIDYSRCIFCGFCVEACPEDAIRMAKEVPDLPGFDRDVMWGRVDMLKGWQPARDPQKPYPVAGAADAKGAP